ncbi:MAG: hypothetical protein JNJ60_14220 [Rhodocyclaceae bacterium]|nr:hypothetical protein [Rhodocyclaceae bacterium]
MPLRISLRAKLAIVALLLLALPWAGYRYVLEMERYLLEGQREALVATARAVATALHERPQLMLLEKPLPAPRAAAPKVPRPPDAAAAGENPAAAAAPPDDPLAQLPGETAAPAEAPPEPAPGADMAERGAEVPAAAAPGGAPPAQAPPRPAPPAAPPAASFPVAPSQPSILNAPPAGVHAAPGGRGGMQEISAILRGLERSSGRIWVVNREWRVVAIAGKLQAEPGSGDDDADAWWRPLIGWLIKRPAEDFDDPINLDLLANGREVSSALLGAPASRVRNTPDGRAVVVSAAHPVWAGDNVVGAVVVEETTNPILSVRNRALERLLVLTLTVFALAPLAILWFAMRLSSRIRRLRDEAESALDVRGRISVEFATSRAGDEIGDLSRSFSDLLRKLSQHHNYVQSLAARLGHELRTPVAVIRSSLENLQLQALPESSQVYIERAEGGLTRLSRILTRMGEATRLEQSLQGTEQQPYDLVAVVRECVSGYAQAYSAQQFELDLPPQTLIVRGQPDLAAQLLDKLVSNAMDFARPGTPVQIAVTRGVYYAELRVTNHGPPLPDALRDRLFDSMVSVRDGGAGGEPHLGLGLYVARLIAEFHGGSIRADNLARGDGVVVTVGLRLV